MMAARQPGPAEPHREHRDRLKDDLAPRFAAERQFLEHLTSAGLPAGEAELLITREWAILAGENDYTTGTFEQITGRPPCPVTEFLHEHRAEFT